MAKIEITVDTSKKNASVKVDGKKISNVRDIFISADSNFFGVDIGIVEDAGDDLVKRTRLLARESKQKNNKRTANFYEENREGTHTYSGARDSIFKDFVVADDESCNMDDIIKQILND